MSKLLVDRELLELLRNFTFLHDDGCAGALRGNIDKALAARPAEEEGVVAWAPSTALEKLRNRHNNAPCVLTDGPAEFNDVPLVPLAALSAVTAERDRLRGQVEDMGLALQDAEERAESAGRNASAFEDRMGDLQVENGRLQDRIRPLMAFAQQMARQEGDPYFQRLARAAMAAKEA